MRIALGSDHRGYKATQSLRSWLERNGHTVTALFECEESCDYPDAAWVVGRAVADGAADRGILVCGSGIGMSMAANKIRGVRAALISDELGAQRSREHNDANVVCLSGDLMSSNSMEKVVRLWLTTEFAGGRHARRVEKIMSIERGDFAEQACTRAMSAEPPGSPA